MKIKVIKVGSLQTNCYIVIDEASNQAIVIDPGDEAVKIIPEINGLTVSSIVITHGHPDHFGALDEIKKITGAKLLAHPADHWFYKPERALNDGDIISCGNINLTVIATPGHSQGGICLFTPGYLFSGDTLFYHTYGRTDLPSSSEEAMLTSLAKLARLPDETIVYPGHDQATTIGAEKEFGTLG